MAISSRATVIGAGLVDQRKPDHKLITGTVSGAEHVNPTSVHFEHQLD